MRESKKMNKPLYWSILKHYYNSLWGVSIFPMKTNTVLTSKSKPDILEAALIGSLWLIKLSECKQKQVLDPSREMGTGKSRSFWPH